MLIRVANLKDAEVICENIIKMADESEHVHLVKPVVLKAVKTLLCDSKKGFYLVAEHNNEIIGQLMITFEWSDWRNTTIWWIQSAYVTPSHRQGRVFTALLNEVKHQAETQKVKLLRLYVHTSNKPAIIVYEKIGMKRTSYVIFETSIENS